MCLIPCCQMYLLRERTDALNSLYPTSQHTTGLRSVSKLSYLVLSKMMAKDAFSWMEIPTAGRISKVKSTETATGINL